jgi:FeS assembly SUF system protein
MLGYVETRQMTDQDQNTSAPSQSEAPKVSLPVLPHSGKVDQLRREGGAGGSTPGPQGKAMMSDNSTAPSWPAGVSSLPEGRETAAPSSGLLGQPGRALQKKLLEAKVIAALHKIYDPEIPIDIYELGLIYEIEIHDDDSVKVQMTLTAPACPVAGSLPGEVERQIESIPEVKSAEVVLVWDPPWSRDRMSEAALLQLGML